MTFVDVLSSALLNACEEVLPTLPHMEWRAPSLAAHMAATLERDNPRFIRAFYAGEQLQLGLEQVSPDTGLGNGAGALNGPVRRPAHE